MYKLMLALLMFFIIQPAFALVDLSGDDNTNSSSQPNAQQPTATSPDGVKWGRTIVIVGDEIKSGDFVNGSLGKGMDLVDNLRLNQFLSAAQPTQTFSWQNSNTHFQFTATAGDYVENPNMSCRKYTIVAFIPNKSSFTGTACKHQDGSWVLLG
ncbi:MAG: hypothetical protein KIT27_10715 [Legionellales bacterium]|nr:hypothetical protein [Legionellales bacterium]